MASIFLSEDERLKLINKTRRYWNIGNWWLETFRDDLHSYSRSIILQDTDDNAIIDVTLDTWRNRDLFGAAEFEIGSSDEGSVVLFLAVPLVGTVSLNVVLSGRLGRMVRRLAEGGQYGQRCLGFSAGGMGDYVFIGLWFWNIHFSVRNVLFGRKVFGPETTTIYQTVISMPEGDYPVEVELRELPWTRPRGRVRSGVNRIWDVTVSGERGIPVPEKGDADDYDLYNDEITVRKLSGVATVEEAVAKVREEVMGYRVRRAGADWRPAAAVAQGE